MFIAFYRLYCIDSSLNTLCLYEYATRCCHNAEIEDSFVVLKVGGNEEDELDTQEQSRWTVTGVEMNNLEALDMDMDICSLKSGVQYPLCGECSLEVEKELMSQIYQIESRTKAFEMLNARYREEQVDNEEHLLCEEQEVDGQIAELEGLLESER